MVNEIIAVVLGYLLGSIPTAYIITRLITGQDIRQMGGGNVGGLNTFLTTAGSTESQTDKPIKVLLIRHSLAGTTLPVLTAAR